MSGSVCWSSRLLWLVFAVPALVRYPLDIDATPVYEGKFTLFVDPDTFAPLDTPACFR